jgi:hypothetical protein
MKHQSGCALIVPRWKLRVSGLSGAESGFGAAVFGELTFPQSLCQPRHTRIAKVFGLPACRSPAFILTLSASLYAVLSRNARHAPLPRLSAR